MQEKNEKEVEKKKSKVMQQSMTSDLAIMTSDLAIMCWEYKYYSSPFFVYLSAGILFYFFFFIYFYFYFFIFLQFRIQCPRKLSTFLKNLQKSTYSLNCQPVLSIIIHTQPILRSLLLSKNSLFFMIKFFNSSKSMPTTAINFLTPTKMWSSKNFFKPNSLSITTFS